MSDYQLQAQEEMYDAIAAQDNERATIERAADERKPSTREPRKASEFDAYYSARNALILDASGATQVAGYREWQSYGRQVRKGEKGIQLAAPVVVKDKTSGDSKVVNMKVTTVFDVSQTDPREA